MENPNNEEKGFFVDTFQFVHRQFIDEKQKKLHFVIFETCIVCLHPFFILYLPYRVFSSFFYIFFWIYESQRVREKSSIKFSIYDVLFITSCVVNFMKTTWVLFRWVPRLWSSWETFVGWMKMFPHRCQPIIFIYY